jgi:pyruvate-ferredoxin/flavodoxin oxidoreductase
LPKTIKSIAVLDRTKEPGSLGEPLYLDIVSALNEAKEEGSLGFEMPHIIGGRYGLSSKEFTPGMIKAIFDELGSDGTVGANKNSIKIIGRQTDHYAQGYFVYDSKKSGSMTTSHLRFGPEPIHSTYLIEKADFVACHQSVFMEKFDILQHAKKGAVFLLNSPFDKEHVWRRMPRVIQEEIIEKEIRFYVIDAYKVAKESKMGRRINTVMQTCFFAISGVLPHDEAIRHIKASIQKTYGKKSDEIVQLNFAAVDNTLEHLYEVTIPKTAESRLPLERAIKGKVSEFVASVTSHLIEGRALLMVLGQVLLRSMKNEISRRKYLFGIPKRVFNVINVCLSVLIPLFVLRLWMREGLVMLQGFLKVYKLKARVLMKMKILLFRLLWKIVRGALYVLKFVPVGTKLIRS